MSLPAEIQSLIDQADFEAIEETWLTHLGDRPDDVRYFSSVATAVAKGGDPERARLLLQMLFDELRQAGHWLPLLEMLRKCGRLVYDDQAKLHRTILEILPHIHGHKPSYEAMAKKVGLHRAIEDIPKTWKKVDQLSTLLTFDVDSIVAMEGKGAGRVIELNLVLESFKIDFEKHPGLLVGFRAAAKLLKPLPPGHFLRTKLEDPDHLRQLRDEDPSELLRRLLESYDGARTGAEIRRDLTGIVADNKWSSWWSSARKHPQVVVESKGRSSYRWAASSADAQEVVWDTFAAAEPRAQLDLLRREGARDRNLRERMSVALAESAEQAQERDPGLACEIFLGLQRHGNVDDGVSWSAAALIRSADSVDALLEGIHDRARRDQAHTIVRKEREDWAAAFASRLLRESETRNLDSLATQLTKAQPDAFYSVFEQMLSAPKKFPAAFTWLAERAAENADWLARSPLRLLKQILWATASDDFATYRVRLQNLAESGGTMPRLLSHLPQDQASQAEQALANDPGLQDYQREPLLNALYLRFPDLRQDQDTFLYATQEAIDEKRQELKRLLEEEIPANRHAIEEARALGDLRENFEYKSARQRHEYLSARASNLSNDLGRARPIDPSQVDGTEVVIGSRVLLRGEEGERTITILGPWNSEPERDILSNESEMAQSLLGRKLDEQIVLADIEYRVTHIEPFTS